MDTMLGIGQKFTLSIMQADQKCNPVKFVQIPQWLSSDQTVATALPAPDGLSAEIDSIAPGSTNITVTADGLTGTWNVMVPGSMILFMPSPTMPK